jgi:pectate lyase
MRLLSTLLAGLSLVSASPLGGGLGSIDLGLASWDLEGYALDNPIGPTTGGKGGSKVTVTTAAELIAAATDNEPRIIYVEGTIELPERLFVGRNKSILGVGWNAQIKQNGLTIRHSDNVIVRNLKISYILDDDCISIINSTRIWIDHNEFESEFSVEVGPDKYVSAANESPWRTSRD